MTTVLLFYFYAAIAIAGALGLVSAKKLLHSVMSLFATLVAIAGIFLLLGAEFLAAMQLFVYGGAMTVLVLFALMFTGASSADEKSSSPAIRWLAIAASVAFLGLLGSAFVTAGWRIAPAAPLSITGLAGILFSRLVVPFEIAGLALTIALIGAIVLAREDDVLLEVAQPDEAGGEA